MTKEKQIEEIYLTESAILANDIAQMCPDLVNSGCGDLSCVTCIAKGLERMGYRQSSDVAREIFEEIEKPLNEWIQLYYKITVSTFDSIEQAKARASESVLRAFSDYVAEIKKKYTEGEK